PDHPATAPLRPGRGGRDLHEPVPALAQGQPPRPATGPTAQAQGPPGVAVHHPTRRPRHEQRLGIGDPRVQARRQGPRLLAHPGHPATTLPDPVLPRQRPQPRTPTHRRHPRRPLVREHRAGRLELFTPPRKPGPPPGAAPAKDRARGRVIALRRQGLSTYEISARLAAEGTTLNRTSVGEI